jgi:hypothetical protein
MPEFTAGFNIPRKLKTPETRKNIPIQKKITLNKSSV